MRRKSARARRKQFAPEGTSTLIDSTLRWLRLDDTVRGMRAMRAFGEAAGPRILARARAERLRGKTLYIRVATSAWSQELHMMRASILERMKALPGGDEVESLRFEVGDVEGLPDWAKAEAAPPAPAKLQTTVPLHDSVHAALAGVEDGELRGWLGGLLARAARR